MIPLPAGGCKVVLSPFPCYPYGVRNEPRFLRHEAHPLIPHPLRNPISFRAVAFFLALLLASGQVWAAPSGPAGDAGVPPGGEPPSESDAVSLDVRIEAAYLFALAKLLSEESRREEAQRAFERSLELDGSDPYGWVELAELHGELAQMSRSAEKRRQHLEKAAEYAETAREMAGVDVDVLRSYAQIYMRLGEHRLGSLNRAQEAFELLREKTEGDLIVLSSLGQIYLWKQEPAKAAEVLEEAASYLPGHRVVHSMLVEAQLGAGDVVKAERALTKLVKIQPGSYENQIRLAELRSQLEDHRGAAEALLAVPGELRSEDRIRQFLARELHLAGENPKALELVDGLIESDSENVGLRRLRVAILTSMARYPEALTELEPLVDAAEEESQKLQDSVLVGRLLERVGRTEEAAERLRSLVAMSSGREAFRLRLALAGTLERQERFDEAAEMLREELSSVSPEHYALTAGTLAEVLERAGRAEEAVQILEEAAIHLEGSDTALGIRLRQLAMMADHEMWEELSEGASQLLTTGNEELRTSALQLKAEAMAGLGDLDAALELLASEPGGDRLVLAKRIELLSNHDRGTEAEELMAKVVAGGTREDLFFAARLYQRLGRYDGVVELMQRLVEEEPESFQALFLLGAARERRGSRDEAEATFKGLLETNPDHAPTLNYLGYMWAETGENLDAALALILRAVSIDPDNGAYVDSLGWAYFRLGRYEQARQHLEWAARLIPSDATIFEHLGDLYLELDQRHRARDFYQQAVQLSGENLDSVRRKLEDLEGEGL